MTSENKQGILERRNWKRNFRILFHFTVSDTLNNSLLLLKKKRKYKFDSNRFKGINLGCSSQNPEQWLGISGGFTIWLTGQPKWVLRLLYPFTSRSKKAPFNQFFEKVKNRRIIHHDLLFGIPFADNSVPNIFSSHFMEHLSYNTARYLVNEMRRTLKPGGKVRVMVPSLETEVRAMESAIQEFQKGNESPVQKFVTAPRKDYTDNFSMHRHMYTAKSLATLFYDTGFINITNFNRGEGNFPDLHLLENRDGIVIEAEK